MSFGNRDDAPTHPEAFCDECGGPNVVWFAPNTVWNQVMPDSGGILCPVCFIRAAERVGIAPSAWCVSPELRPPKNLDRCVEIVREAFNGMAHGPRVLALDALETILQSVAGAK